jgi:Mrp family chromosome partitioning ATPase
MIISIAIADKNTDYLNRISEALNQENDLNISMFTNQQVFQNALEREKFDIVLFDPDISDEVLKFSNVKLAVCLYSDEAINSKNYADLDNVSKYQRISNIYKKVISKYAEKAGYTRDSKSSQKTRIIATYSPIGGSGKTIISLAMASKLVEYGEKVLFLSAEQLNSSSAIFPDCEDGITALVNVFSEEVVFDLKLKGIVKSGMNGISYVEGFKRIIDYRDVTKDEFGKVLESIRNSEIYDMVIVDAGSTIDEITEAIFEKATHIVLVNKPGEFPAMKMSMLANQSLILENINKIVKVNNFAENNSIYNNELEVPKIGMVHHYGNLDEKGIIKAINTNKEIDVRNF